MSVAERGASALLFSALLSLASARTAPAACVSQECPNDAIVEPVRQMIASACDCDGAKSHKKYVRCAKEVIKGAIRASMIPADCKKTIRRCEARSTCGIDGAMVCCTPKGEGRIKAQVTKKESRCRGNVCPGPLTTADACRADGTCAPPRRGLKSFRSVQQVFNTSCSLATCHSTLAREGNLVLENEGISYANLVGRESTLPEAQQQGLLRVKPGDPDNSFLIRKLRSLGPGDAMPQAGGPLPEPVVAMIADWVRRGAHTTAEECPPRSDGRGTVCDDDGPPPGNYVWQPEPPLEIPAANQGIQLYTPPRDVTPGSEWETCYAFPVDSAALAAQFGLPANQLPVISQQTYRMHQGSHHLLLYMYFGTDPGGWTTGRYFPCQAANCIDAADCPSDAGRFLLPIGGTQVAGTRYEVNYPQGIGIPLLGSVVIANLHYTNPFQPPQPIHGEAWLNLYFYGPNEFKAILDGIFAINANDLIVEPYETRTISAVWQPRNILTRAPEDGALFQLFGHFHKRGTAFQIDSVKGGICSGSAPDDPRACGRDSDCACKPWRTNCTPGQTCVRGPNAEDTTIYYTTEWDAAPVVDFSAPYFLVNRDEGLRWTCTHVNGIPDDPAYPPKRCHEGCEACGWDPPSRTCRFCQTLQRPRFYWNVAAQSCFEDDAPVPDAPRVFAEGQPMPLVFGLLADDDMCNMFGYFINQADLSKIQ